MDLEREKPKGPPEGERRALLLGLGFDGDGQKRITVGKNFLLAGGSAPTHERMQEKAIKFNEELDRRRKRLEDIEPAEFHEIADQIRMHEEP
jgi:hypothetical protein